MNDKHDPWRERRLNGIKQTTRQETMNEEKYKKKENQKKQVTKIKYKDDKKSKQKMQIETYFEKGK